VVSGSTVADSGDSNSTDDSFSISGLISEDSISSDWILSDSRSIVPGSTPSVRAGSRSAASSWTALPRRAGSRRPRSGRSQARRAGSRRPQSGRSQARRAGSRRPQSGRSRAAARPRRSATVRCPGTGRQRCVPRSIGLALGGDVGEGKLGRGGRCWFPGRSDGRPPGLSIRFGLADGGGRLGAVVGVKGSEIILSEHGVDDGGDRSRVSVAGEHAVLVGPFGRTGRVVGR
jgi:hypothetical protein